MKNLTSVILIFVSFICCAQEKKETLKIGSEKYKVSSYKGNNNYKSRFYDNINNKFTDSIPEYEKDPMEPYLGQKKISPNQQKRGVENC